MYTIAYCEHCEESSVMYLTECLSGTVSECSQCGHRTLTAREEAVV